MVIRGYRFGGPLMKKGTAVTDGIRWTAGLDWLALTYVDKGSPEAAYVAYETAVHTVAAAYDGTARTVPWAAQGYRGEKVGKAAFGTRDDGCMLVVTGAWALHPALLQVPYTGVPRADTQVTIWGLSRHAERPKVVGALSRRAAARCGRKPWHVPIWDGDRKGDTAYLGARSSDEFVRVYDKEKESGDEVYEGALRYEVQASAGRAAQYYKDIARSQGSPYTALGIVQGALVRKGVALPGAILCEAAPSPHCPPKAASSLDSTLKWLVEGVAPTVARLEREGVPYELLHRYLFGRRHEVSFDEFGQRVVDYRPE
jgi:hypothetical protein